MRPDVTQPPVKALDEGILLRLAGRDLMTLDACLLGPEDRHTGELHAVVGDAHGGMAKCSNERVTFAHDPQSRQRRIRYERDILA